MSVYSRVQWVILFAVVLMCVDGYTQTRTLSIEEYRDKMKGGWIGQMAGVGWGGPTEFRWQGEIIPEDAMPSWKPEMINQFGQDDIYVEMTFMRSMEEHGLNVSIRQAGIDFANSEYALWHANRYGRQNLRAGIAPPDSGHPQFNAHADDIDYQIEADFSGLIAPGMPNLVIRLGETFGRLMNYGDGIYGGQFVGGMYAEAFFETDMMKVVEAGLRCIPEDSLYAQTIRDVIAWYKEEPNDWIATWEKIEAKYQDNPDNRLFSCSGNDAAFNIDAKINGAYIVMGLLYGKGDIDQTIIISTRCGQDSDCNPSNAAGVLCTSIGYSNLPEKYTSALDETQHFSHTAYNFDSLTKVSEKLVRDAVLQSGGQIITLAGKETFEIPIQEPVPSALELSWEPGPIANSRFTEEEMAQIRFGNFEEINQAMQQFAPEWQINDCGDDMNPGFKPEALGKERVFVTHPYDHETPCVLSQTLTIPEGASLQLVVGHHPEGDWDLIVKADDETLLKQTIGGEQAWHEIEVDLSQFAGDEVQLQLLNQPTGWTFEAAYWASIELVH